MEIDVVVLKSVVWDTIYFECPKCDHKNEVRIIVGTKIVGKKECWYCDSTLKYKQSGK